MAAENATTSVFDAVRTEATSIGGLSPTITVSGDDSPWQRVRDGVEVGATALGSLSPTITVSGDDSPWQGVRDGVATAAAVLGQLSPTITVSGNDNTGAAFDSARAGAVQVGSLSPTITVGGNDNTGAAFNLARAAAVQLGALNPTITVSGNDNTGRAFATAIAAAVAIGRLHPTVTVDADTTGATAHMITFKGVVEGVTSATSGLSSAVSALEGPLAMGGLLVVFALAVAAVGPLLGILTIAAGVATAFAVGIGLLALGFVPLIKQITDAKKANEEYTTAQKAAQSSSDALTKAQQKQQDAQDKVNKLTEQGSSSNVKYGATSQQVTTSQNALSSAQARLETANISLQQATDAYNAALARYGPNSQQAATASENLQKAQISQQQAQQAVDAATQKYNDTQSKSNTVVATGKGGADQLATAQKQLDRANQDVATAAQKNDDAQTKLSNTTNLQSGYVGTLMQAWDRLKQSYTDNVLKNQDLGNAFADLGTKVIDLATNAMPQLATAATNTATSMDTAFQGVIDKAGSSASDSLSTILQAVPGLMGNMTTAAGYFGAGFLSIMAQSMPYVTDFGYWIADIAEKFFRWSDSAEGREQIKRFMDAAVPVAKALWKALTDIVPKLIDIGINYGPTVAIAIDDIARFVNFLLDAINWILPVVDAFIKSLGDLGNIFQDSARSSGKTTEQIRGDWSQLGTDLNMNQGDLEKAILGHWGFIYDALVGSSIVPDTINGIGDWFGKLPGIITNALANLPSDIGNVFTSTWNDWILPQLNNWVTNLYNTGVDLITGLINGLTSKATDLYNEVTSIGHDIIQWMKGSTRSHSPSEASREVAQDIGNGMVLGLRDSVGRVRSAARELARAALPNAASTGDPSWEIGGPGPGPVGGAPSALVAGIGTVSPLPAPPFAATGGVEERLARLEALSAQTNALLSGGIRLDDDSAGRIGGAAAGGVGHRLANDRWMGTQAVRGLTRYADRKQFGGSL